MLASSTREDPVDVTPHATDAAAVPAAQGHISSPKVPVSCPGH